jgi:opacity protein-like surface antigen
MIKKMVIASAILLTSSTAVFADVVVPYVGAELGYDSGRWKIKDVTGYSQTASAYGAIGGLFVGLGWMVDRLYLGGELFGSANSAQTNTRQVNTSTVPANVIMRSRYTWGASVIPGFRFNSAALLYFRLSALRTRFAFHQTVVPAGSGSNLSLTNVTGGQAGIGLQGDWGNHWGARVEYDYTKYKTFSTFRNSITARDNIVKVGLLYNFC